MPCIFKVIAVSAVMIHVLFDPSWTSVLMSSHASSLQLHDLFVNFADTNTLWFDYKLEIVVVIVYIARCLFLEVL